jgi:Flp pilus assembly pilin Flp
LEYGIINYNFINHYDEYFKNPIKFFEGLPMESIRRFIREETGITAGEYGVMLGAIAGVLIMGLVFFFGELGNLFSRYGAWFVGGAAP